MRIRSKRKLAGLAGVITILACCVVGPAIMLLYPRDQWAWELPLSLGLTIIISAPVSYFMGAQLLRITLLQQELQRLLERDRLTDVATRDFFFEKMEATPEAYGVSLMIDIDHFKAVNDRYGHFAGDQVIRHVAQILRANTRTEDIVARFGGEEFMVFLSGHSVETGYVVAERMRAAIAAENVVEDEMKVQVTVSIGGSLKEAHAQVEAAIKAADAALYLAKQGGRNRTVFDRRKIAA